MLNKGRISVKIRLGRLDDGVEVKRSPRGQSCRGKAFANVV
jgi:hypothetical protein